MPALADGVPSETRSDAGMQAFEFLLPLPDFDKGGFGSYWGDVLGLLHVLLLSSEISSNPYYS
jgi:hypothetical protein